MRRIIYEDTIYNNPLPQPWDTDPDYLAERQAHLAHWRPLYQAIEDFEFFADGTLLPPGLVAQQELAQAERRDIVFDYFLRYYEATVAAGQPLDYYQQQYRSNLSATKATHAGEVCQGLFVLQQAQAA